MKRLTNPERFLTESEEAAINAAIRQAELSSSAELKVVLVRHCWGNLKVKARRIFRELGLEKTQQRNCVLVMLVVTNKEFLIYGDQGIHEKTGQGFWDDVRDRMGDAFAQEEFGEGLSGCIRQIGEKLAQYFPSQRDDVDEISNEIIYRN